MSKYALRLPDSLYKAAQQLAQADGVSLNQFIAIAVAEKVSALNTEDFLARRGEQADIEAYQRVLDRIPDVPPVAGDGLPEQDIASDDQR